MVSADSVEVKSLTGMETRPKAMVAEAMGRAAMDRVYRLARTEGKPVTGPQLLIHYPTTD